MNPTACYSVTLRLTQTAHPGEKTEKSQPSVSNAQTSVMSSRALITSGRFSCHVCPGSADSTSVLLIADQMDILATFSTDMAVALKKEKKERGKKTRPLELWRAAAIPFRCTSFSLRRRRPPPSSLATLKITRLTRQRRRLSCRFQLLLGARNDAAADLIWLHKDAEASE